MAPRRGAVALGITAALLLVLVVAEIAAIVWVAGHIGWWTLVLIGATTVLGFYLMQREWRKAWSALSEAIRSGQLPTGQMADASLVLAGGILLTVPGLLTDVLGLLLLLPFTRPFVRSGLSWWAGRVLKPSSVHGGPTVIRGTTVPDPTMDTLIPGIAVEKDEAADGNVIRGDLDDQ
ncbi:hypothetical protein GCM10025789_21080 [Tessaracoccus lubricantis]|uniref:Exlusion protein FxsA n=1 Tax=Tessaracoccus lubricantis TaxID=545543 RepID=A0ABP9FHZ2_9ACTN